MSKYQAIERALTKDLLKCWGILDEPSRTARKRFDVLYNCNEWFVAYLACESRTLKDTAADCLLNFTNTLVYRAAAAARAYEY